MKLLYSPTSPYARKVLVVGRMKGFGPDRLAVESVSASVTARNDALYAKNPLGKIPCLIDGQRVIYDSPVIAAYLDSKTEPSLHDVKGYDRFHSMTLEALCDGLLDAALLCRYELASRPENLRWDMWLSTQSDKMHSAIFEMEQHWLPFLQAGPSIGAVAAGCALDYVNFRFPESLWRNKAPALAAWFDIFSTQPVMAETAPPKS